MSKFIFVTGGVVSGLGKGITAASMAMLIKRHDLYGFTVVRALALALDNRPVNLAAGDIGVFGKILVQKPLVMPEHQVALAAVVGDENLAVLERTEIQPETDVVVCEIGGVVGDIENHPYLEAIRQCRATLGKGIND